MKLIISITAIFALSATLFGADIDFNSSPLGAEEVPGCQGRYDIVEVTEGDHALRVYSDGKEDFGGARIPLLEGKVIEKNFKLFVDCQLTTAHAAGRLVSIGDWNANEWLLRIDAVGGKMMLRGTSFRTGKPADRELCAYKSGEWLRVGIAVNRKTGTYDVSIKPHDSKQKPVIVKHLKLNPKGKDAVYLDTGTWPGQNPYAFHLDNITVEVAK
ncbi:MAG TPA: hypothetical protein DCR55_01910 [Lentisphaeria bacterium]|jgi:hypothetical protein|nr:hypothetical protein [Lentisphaeria bacterium]